MIVSFDCIRKKVKEVKRKYDESDPFKLCEMMGIKLKFKSMGTKPEDCKGFFLVQHRIKCIVINSDLSPVFQRIICAHEIGHAVMHSNRAGVSEFHEFELFDSVSTFEYEANIFAAEFLLEDDVVLELLNDYLSFFQAAAKLNVPTEILDFKFRMLKGRGYKIVEPPISSSSNWLKDAEDSGEPNYYEGA